MEEEHLEINSGYPDPSQSLCYLLERSPTPLHYRQPVFPDTTWVFWGKNEGSEINSSSADLHEKIKMAFYLFFLNEARFLAQLWVPVTIGGRRLLSTSGQPFAVGYLSKKLANYRLYSEEYKYDIDVNKHHTEADHDPKIKSDGPATTFLNRLAYMGESESCFGFKSRILLPICLLSQSDCIGVVEITSGFIGLYVLDVLEALKDAGLDVCNVQERIPFKAINGLTPAKDEIKHALEIVCKSHNLCLAQAWIAFEDKNQMPLTSYSGDTRRILGLKLASYFHGVCFTDENFVDDFSIVGDYEDFSDVFPMGTGYEHVLKTLQDFKPRYISKLRDNLLLDWELLNNDYCAFAICLRSLDIGDFSFAFQYIWPKYSRCEILLEAILLTIKTHLPSFKFASGVEIGVELDAIEVGCSEDGQTSYDFKLFRGKRSSQIPKALEKGKQPIVTSMTTLKVLPLEDMEKQSDVICVKRPMRKTMAKNKTDEIVLTREDIEKHYDKTMKQAAKILEVSITTLRRKLRNFGIPGWPKHSKRNKSDLSINQMDTNEEDNVATQKPSPMTLKAEYAGYMIKISHLNSQATFETIEKEICMKFNLSFGTYNLTYRDEDEDWVLLKSDADLRDCIKCSRKSDRIVIRVRVLPSTNIQS